MWNKKSLVNLHVAKYWCNIHQIADGCDVLHNGNISAQKVFEKAWINHYFSKSWEDYCIRIQSRGNMNNSIRSYDQFFIQNPELLPRMRELIEKERYKHAKCTMYLSRRMGLISGGNIDIIKQIEDGTYGDICDDVEILYV
jgi:hypothetical protein